VALRPEQRRRLDRVLLPFGAAVVGLAALIGAFAGDTERIGAYWAHADIDATGTASITEVIDYDFGSARKHGLLRQIPDVSPTAAFTVDSPTAPDQVAVSPWWLGTELRVGDPDVTISNRHRYTIDYPHTGLIFGPDVIWNAVGDGWDVPVNDVEIHLTSERELLNPSCDTGVLGSTGGCTVEVVGPGHIVVTHDRVDPGEFLTVRATLGAPVTPTLPAPPTGPAPDPGTGWITPTLLAFLAALGGGLVISPMFRRLGREWVWDGGPVVAAFGPDDAAAATRRLVDHDELREMTTIEFEAPRDLSAALGGVVHSERVLDDHKTAWLLECAIREEIELDTDGESPEIRRGTATPNPAVAAVLDKMFGGGDLISLEKYDPAFSSGWDELGTALEEWRRTAGLWDRQGRTRRSKALGFGVLGLVAGLAATVATAAFANRSESGWLPLLAAAALVAGLGIASLIRAWELRIRTPEGTGAWIRVESFRRFLHESEASHVERAADMGLLRQYTAWAVALGEVDRWERAVDAAVSDPASTTASLPHQVGWVTAAPVLSRSFSTASTAPSSSGSGGGGSGGGGGGGGGGSW
jgi:Predicted membrane protein (DUF2207) C-terminal domain/Predicted membrane protein (DUF2207) N-terminal domain